jgi:hypothetical protein
LAGAEHWAFQKLARPPVPRVKDVGRVRSPIDAFILARLEAEGLRFATEADRMTLLRRVSLDLTGLPPPPQEIQEFLEDRRPDAYERLIDRLLASPHFGERWGRHWVDGAGYVDVLGSDNDAATIKLGEGKWRYRDYVIRSLNDDKPFDRFLTEQLAGDELSDWRSAKALAARTCETLVATGFLRVAADDTDEKELNVPSTRHGVLQRTVEIVVTNLLGMTFQCAKCHDHKYEPISQRDYYRTLAVLQPAFNPDSWLTPAMRQLPMAMSNEGRKVAELLQGKQSPPHLQVVYDVGPPTPTHLLRRGDPLTPGVVVQPGFLRVLCGSEEETMCRPASVPNGTSGRRLALAHWLTDANSRGAALVLRVRVNRIWQQLFGRGLVETSDNLGLSGSPPTHPELLEWLAAEFGSPGGSTKSLICLLMTSSVYRQASVQPPGQAADEAQKRDPENRLLGRMRPRRLESEAIRDGILAVSGKLDQAVGGPPIPVEPRPDGTFIIPEPGPSNPTSQWRRSVYLLARRNYHPGLLAAFDQPDMAMNCTRRASSAVVQQSLSMLNDRFVHEQAEFRAQRVAKIGSAGLEAEVKCAFLIVLGRFPGPRESAWCVEALEHHARHYRSGGDRPAVASRKALAHLCQTLLNTSEFMYIP